MLHEYGNLVDFWITINEPLVYAAKGYLEGLWPPRKRNPLLFLRVLQNQVMAHRRVYEIFHRRPEIKVGIAKNNQFFEPYDKNSFFDRAVAKIADYFWNHWFLGKIKHCLDFIGLNYYFHNVIAFPLYIQNENHIVSDIGWEIYPSGIFHTLVGLKRYQKPIYITENGVADAKDLLRKDFIRDHLFWVHKAIQEGTDVRGYFHWSLMDNFEWEKGFEPRFGLVEIDYNTLERKIRSSAYYYAEICKNNSFLD
jgi:beta-glucosidase